MIYICDNCGKTEKLVPTKEGKYLCRLCMVKRSLKPKIDFCCKCLSLTPHNLVYGRGKEKSILYSYCKVCRTKSIVENQPTKEDLIGHRKVDLQGL